MPMRKIKKTPKPQVLIDHAKEWTTEYCAYLTQLLIVIITLK